MGTSIHYSGRLRSAVVMDELVKEVAGVAEALGWTHHTVEDESLRGVVLEVHEDCDPVVLLADRDGLLRFPFEELDEHSLRISVRTRCAPGEVHLAIVRLFRHLNDRYFSEFVVDDDSGYWESGDRHAFVKHHPCVSVLTDRLAAAPADLLPAPDDSSSTGLLERLEHELERLARELDDVSRGEPGPDYDEPFRGSGMEAAELEDEGQAFPPPLPPEDEVLVTWDVGDWVDYFERHDRSRNSFLGFMSGRAETEDQLAVALRQAEEDDARSERRARRTIRRIEREMVDLRRRRAAGEDPAQREAEQDGAERMEGEAREPWKASLPRFSEEPSGYASGDGLDYGAGADDWAAIAAECPALDDALDIMRALNRRETGTERGDSPVLRFVRGSISTTVIGVGMGYYHWSRSEGYPLARTARYAIASRRFSQVSRLLERMEDPELQEIARRARSTASGFASAADESPGGRTWGR